jgi:hypothetical protein
MKLLWGLPDPSLFKKKCILKEKKQRLLTKRNRAQRFILDVLIGARLVALADIGAHFGRLYRS